MTIEAGNLRARFWHEEGRLRHAVDVRRGNRWRAFLVSGGDENSDERIVVLDFLELAQPPQHGRVVFQAHLDDIAVGLQAVVIAHGVLYFSADLRLRLPSDFSRFCQSYEVAWPSLDDIWVPQLAPQPDDVIGQHTFRCPGVALQSGKLALCLIPDLDLIETTWTKMPVAFEVDADARVRERPFIAYGCMNYRARDNAFVAAAEEPTTFVFRDVMSFGWYVLLDQDCPAGDAWRRVVRFCWEKWGREIARELRPQTVPWHRYAEVILPVVREALWTGAGSGSEMRGGIATGHIPPPQLAKAMGAAGTSSKPQGGSRSSQPSPPQPLWPADVWFSCRDNDLFTALGLRLWAALASDEDLARRAEAVKNLILSAPRDDGFFPTVYWSCVAAGRREEGWVASNFYGGGHDLYATADMSWTAELMLRWFELAEADPRLVDFAEQYGWALLDVQAPCGAIPAWVRVADRRPAPRLAESIHTAMSAAFLAHLARVTDEDAFLEAALDAERFVREHLLPARRFGDFEQFFDGPGLPEGFFDPRTRQLPQGTLGVFWTTEMYRHLHLATGDASFADAASRWAEYLALWQCIWDPPFFSTQVRGGFSPGNCSLAWTDARSALFAVGFADLYELTGRLEMLQRAVLAVRSAFVTVYCEENEPVAPRCFDIGPGGCAASGWGAGATDAPCREVGFDWGAGSALAAAGFMRHRFGDLFVDARLPAAIGINGLAVMKSTISAQAVAVEVHEATEGLRRIRLRGTGFAPEAVVSVEIEGAITAKAEASGAELESGVWVDIA